MSALDPKRVRDALDLLVANAEDAVGRARARITALVASVAADAQALVERSKCDGADAVDAAFVAMHVRELVSAQADLAAQRERLRQLQGVIEFAERTRP